MADASLVEEQLTHSVIGAFFDVYNTLGYGFLEAIYVAALEVELVERGHQVEREVLVPVFYKGARLARQRIDMIVDRTLVVETKSTATLHPSAKRQVISYLKGTGLRVGLLLHFGLEPRVQRVVNSRPSRGWAGPRSP